MTRESMVRLAMVAAMALLVTMVGCQTTPKEEEKPDTGSEWDEGTGPATTGGTTPVGDVKTVYFDFNKSDIRSDARATLQSNAGLIFRQATSPNR